MTDFFSACSIAVIFAPGHTEEGADKSYLCVTSEMLKPWRQLTRISHQMDKPSLDL